jgi:hypothetical protein
VTIVHNPSLRSVLEQAAAEHKLSMKALTVLDEDNDPYRLDTPAGHRDGGWLATAARDLGLGDRKIHLRGLHYMVLGRTKPNGLPYANTAKDWTWLSEDAGKAARFLGYIDFDQIIDQRNAPPTVQRFTPPEPEPYITVGIEVEIPDVDDIVPQVAIDDFTGTQPYKLVFIGEKASLGEVLAPIAKGRYADLYLPTGESSSTLIYQMAKIGAADGRPMVVLYFSDCDPAGWQMGVSVCRKLQAFKTRHFPSLEYQVRRVALTPDQVREYGLPETPLKETEKRADKWQTLKGVAQTEIDALATLRPDLLRQLARNATLPYFDLTLEGRVRQARQAWIAQAQAWINEQLDPDALERIRGQAAARLAEMRAEIDELNSALHVATDGFTLPDLPEIPGPDGLAEEGGLPLLDSRWSWAEQTRRLIASKAYRD